MTRQVAVHYGTKLRQKTKQVTAKPKGFHSGGVVGGGVVHLFQERVNSCHKEIGETMMCDRQHGGSVQVKSKYKQVVEKE